MNEPTAKRLNFFERYLSLWVLICMVVGVALGKLLPGAISALSKLEFGQGSQVNTGGALFLTVSALVLCAAGDHVWVGARADSGGTIASGAAGFMGQIQ